MDILNPVIDCRFSELQDRCTAFNKVMYGESPTVPFTKPFAFVSHMMWRDSLTPKITDLMSEGKSISIIPLMDGSFAKTYFPEQIDRPNEASLLQAYVMEISEWDAICNNKTHKSKATILDEYLSKNRETLLNLLEVSHIRFFNRQKKKPIDYIDYQKTPISDTTYKSVPLVSLDLDEAIRQDIYAVLPFVEYNDL